MKFTFKKRRFEFKGTSENDWIYKCIVENDCFYEKDLLKYIYKIRRFIKSTSDTIIDIGANIGNHPVYFHLLFVKVNYSKS